MTPAAPRPIAMRELLDRHAGLLLDVFGVLVDARGALPGARELIGELVRRQQPYAIVTNDASRSAATWTRRFAELGLPIGESHIITAGSLVPAYLAQRGLRGARVCVLGTADSFAHVREGGADPLAPAAGIELDALAVCDDDGYDFLPGIEHALSAVVRAIEAGRRPALLLPNPDLVYPKGGGELGFTAGAVGLLLEAALARRFPSEALTFDRLGKPAPHLFAAGAARLGVAPAELVMVGDQLETDIAGARAAGCAAALVAGVSRWEHAKDRAHVTPDYLLESIAP